MLALVCLFPFRFLLFSPRNRVLLVCTELCSLHMQLVSRMKAHCLQEAVDVCEPVAQFPSACLSAQIFQDDRVDNMVGSALFADGSGALVIGAELRDGERPLFEMHRNASVIIPDTIDMMDWILTKSGMSIGLGREIPDASQCDPTATDADSAGKRQQRELPQLTRLQISRWGQFDPCCLRVCRFCYWSVLSKPDIIPRHNSEKKPLAQ